MEPAKATKGRVRGRYHLASGLLEQEAHGTKGQSGAPQASMATKIPVLKASEWLSRLAALRFFLLPAPYAQ